MGELIINYDALTQILCGSAFLGSGGGGSRNAGEFFLQRIVDTHEKGKGFEIPLWTLPLPEDKKDLLGCIVCDIGANGALDPKQDDALLHAYDTMQDHIAQGKKISAVFPAETGAENTLAPFVVAAARGLAVVDGDGAGRAIPTLPLCTFSLDENLKGQPMTMANGEGDRMLVNSESNTTHEALIRDLVQLKRFNNSASLAAWHGELRTLVKKCVSGAVSTAMHCGRLFEGLRTGNEDMVDKAVQEVNKLSGYIIGKGELVSADASEAGGFSFARIKIRNEKSRVIYTLVAQNESLICYTDNSPYPVAYAPTSICCMGINGVPYTNAELITMSKEKKQLTVFLVAVMPQDELVKDEITKGFTEIMEQLVVVSPTIRLERDIRHIMELGDLIVNLWRVRESFVDQGQFLHEISKKNSNY